VHLKAALEGSGGFTAVLNSLIWMAHTSKINKNNAASYDLLPGTPFNSAMEAWKRALPDFERWTAALAESMPDDLDLCGLLDGDGTARVPVFVGDDRLGLLRHIEGSSQELLLDKVWFGNMQLQDAIAMAISAFVYGSVTSLATAACAGTPIAPGDAGLALAFANSMRTAQEDEDARRALDAAGPYLAVLAASLEPEHFTQPVQTDGPGSLTNRGHICYFIALMQKLACLLSADAIRLLHSSTIPVAKMLAELVDAINTRSSGRDDLATQLRNALPNFARKWVQHDVAELLDALSTALCSCGGTLPCACPTNVIAQMFQFTVEHSLCCGKCGGTTYKRGTHLSHTIHFTGPVATTEEDGCPADNVPAMLAKSLESEVMDGDNQIRCDDCGLQDARRRSRLLTTP
jgi:hypothetical protein